MFQFRLPAKRFLIFRFAVSGQKNHFGASLINTTGYSKTNAFKARGGKGTENKNSALKMKMKKPSIEKTSIFQLLLVPICLTEGRLDTRGLSVKPWTVHSWTTFILYSEILRLTSLAVPWIGRRIWGVRPLWHHRILRRHARVLGSHWIAGILRVSNGFTISVVHGFHRVAGHRNLLGWKTRVTYTQILTGSRLRKPCLVCHAWVFYKDSLFNMSFGIF